MTGNRKVPAGQLRIGMFVAELDRPWSQAPFEPPFELQAFTIQTADELEKVRNLCDYVFVDPVKSGLPADAFTEPVPAVAETASASLTSESSTVDAPAPSTPEPLTDLQRSVDDTLRVTWREQRYAPGSATPDVPPAPEYDEAILIERVAGSPGSGQQKRLPRYADSVSVEQELTVASEVINDTETIFERIAEGLRSDEPLDLPEIRVHVENLVESVIRNPDALSLLTRLKQQDGYTYGHAMSVCVLAITLGRYLGLSQQALRDLGMGALLQDVGKLSIPTEVLQKHDALNNDERFAVSRHVDLSLDMLTRTDDFPTNAIDIVRHHHERHDGSGYPLGLAGRAINPYSVIAAIADTYEAMTNERPYRDALNSYEALGELYSQREQLFPTAMIENLIQCVGVFPVGSVVELDNFHIGIVVGRNEQQQLKPRVMVVVDNHGERLSPLNTVDLAASADEGAPRKILRVVDPADFGIDTAEFFL